MKFKNYSLLILLLCAMMSEAQAQWTSGTDIENNNTGDVKIKSGSDLRTSGQILSMFPKSNTALTGEFLGSNGYWGFRTSTDDSFHLDVYNSNSAISAISVDQTGRVGIGKSSPAYKLDVDGDIHVGQKLRFYRQGIGASPFYIESFQNNAKINVNSVSDYLTFNIGSGAPERMRITNSGNVGIGTSSPTTKLHIVGTGNIGDVAMKSEALGGGGHTFEVGNNGLTILSKDYGGLSWVRTNTAIGYGRLIANSYGITLATSTDNSSYSDRFFVAQAGNVGIGTTSPTYLLDVTRANHNVARFTSTGTNSGADVLIVDADNVHTRAALQIQGNGGAIEAFFVGSTGRVGIGTVSPDEKLTVAGNIHSQEVKVTIGAGTGPDYVFADNYDLPSLETIEKFIQSNKHLPEIPTAKEMEEKGIELGEMNMLLLKKIEELTLHIIRMDKELQELRSGG